MDDWKIKLSYKSYLGQLKFCATSIKKFISHENKICHQTHPCHASLTSHCSKFTNVKTFLTLKLSQHLKSGSTCCSSVPVAALIDCQCCRLGNTLCLCLPVLSSQTVQELPQKTSHWYHSQNLSFSWSDCQMNSRGSNLAQTLTLAELPEAQSLLSLYIWICQHK